MRCIPFHASEGPQLYSGVGQLAELEVNQQMALEDDVVEDEVDVELLLLEGQTLQPRDECDPLAQLEEELGQLVDDRRFKVALAETLALGQVEERWERGPMLLAASRGAFETSLSWAFLPGLAVGRPACWGS
jgi:hypothetical protein